MERFAFGSCNHHDDPQPVWANILAYRPSVWAWLGDVVYADHRSTAFVWVPSSLEVMEERFKAQKNRQEYRALTDTVPVIGTWDDHDFGLNNGGKRFMNRSETQQLFLDFLDEPSDSPRRRQEGVYGAWTYGTGDRKVMAILLDVRYGRDDPNSHGGSIMSKEQWDWFEAVLKNSDARVHIIGSGIQVMPNDKAFSEKWGHFPDSRARLIRAMSRVPNPILISGDVHYGELFDVSECTIAMQERPPGYQCTPAERDDHLLHEITSSGLTHSIHSSVPFGLGDMSLLVMNSRYTQAMYSAENFGLVTFEWDAQPPTMHLAVHAANGTRVIHRATPIKQREQVPHRLEAFVRTEPQPPGWVFWPLALWMTLFLGSIFIPVALIMWFIWRRCIRVGGSVVKSKGHAKSKKQ
eukprot:TRINITY_DN6400_c0_g1_i5.p2 TRINITY_DN6400_c0_g1~~TRINITY_DN6400_c0_g1_i5.p2  ORF type:complete len:408 (+),score=58.12 TRINITY_DN6400_c0_g1_i5:1408-2631(+)